jgi:TPR repeat protein
LKSAWLAPAGALLAVFIAAGAAIGFVRWRADEQRHALATHTDRCRNGVRESCDWLRTACGKRAALACFSLAETYLTGQGVDQSYGEALALGDDACRLGNAAGCLLIGGLLRDGSHVPGDPEKAKASFERACALGNQDACGFSGATR